MTQEELPSSHVNNSLSTLDRGVGGYNAARAVYNIAQLHFNLATMDVRAAQTNVEQTSITLLSRLRREYAANKRSMSEVSRALSNNAVAHVKAWWDLSDQLLLRYADGYCNSCGHDEPRHLGYPEWWLRQVNNTKKRES